jgi:hypothetical protein
MKDGGRIIVVGSNIVSANWVPWCECLPPTASRKPPTHRQRKSAENKVERTKALVLYYLQSREITKMEGKQFTLRCHKNPQDSVRISDPSLIPLRLKRVEARFDGGTWERIVACCPGRPKSRSRHRHPGPFSDERCHQAGCGTARDSQMRNCHAGVSRSGCVTRPCRQEEGGDPCPATEERARHREEGTDSALRSLSNDDC